MRLPACTQLSLGIATEPAQSTAGQVRIKVFPYLVPSLQAAAPREPTAFHSNV